jgi:hypothetical protein
MQARNIENINKNCCQSLARYAINSSWLDIASTSLCKEACPPKASSLPLTWLPLKPLLSSKTLSLPERLRCRIRYFTDGVILGSQSFVESHFYKLKQKLGYKRRCPATRLTALGFTDTLWVFRDLRVRPIG